MRINSREGYLQISIVVFILLFLPVLIFSLRNKLFFVRASSDQALSSVADQKTLKNFTSEELKKYNGTDPALPIYLALDGNVYDVTRGSEFYKIGGSYHYLAGKDSSFELHMVGGDIIKRKYPIVGKYTN